MSKREAKIKAARQAASELASINLNERLALHGFTLNEKGLATIRAFGQDNLFNPIDQTLTILDGTEAKLDDQILIFHYLLNESSVKLTNEPISFRSLPGGDFYWEPFQSRTTVPLVKRTGNDLDGLRERLDRFDWTPVDQGDFAAQIHAIGAVGVTLVYHLGDDEFPPDATVMFDGSIKHAFNAEDAAVLASRVCIGLL